MMFTRATHIGVTIVPSLGEDSSCQDTHESGSKLANYGLACLGSPKSWGIPSLDMPMLDQAWDNTGTHVYKNHVFVQENDKKI